MRISIFLALFLATAAYTSAQDDFSVRRSDRVEIKTVVQSGIILKSHLRLRARDLAASTADEAYKWEDTQMAVPVLSQAADLLWADYPERSRAWLVRAWEMTGAIT